MMNRHENKVFAAASRRRGGAGLWVLAASGGTAVIALWFGLFGGSGDKDDAPGGQSQAAEWFDVTRQSFDLTVVAAGDLEAKQQVVIKCKVQDRGTIIVDVVEEGSAVKKGDILVRLDDSETRNKMQQEELTVEQAIAAVVAAEQTLLIAASKAQSDQKAVELKLALAGLNLDKWLSGDVKQKRNDLLLAKETADRTVIQTARDYKLSIELFDQDFISASELDQDEIKKLEAEGRLKTADIASEVYESYTYPMEQKQFNSDVEQAKEELARTIQSNASLLAQLAADLKSKRSSLRIRRDRLAEYQQQIEYSIMRAPLDGLVVYATSGQQGRRRSTSPIQQGRSVSYNEPIIIIPDTRQMVAVLRVHESKLPNVKVGQSASVHVDARPGLPMPGIVTSIAVMAANGGWLNPQLREYNVRVELPPGIDTSLKPSMRCSGEIIIGRVEDAITVPITAVYTEGKHHFCYVPAGSKRVARTEVKIGRSSDMYVEVLDGLSEGDRVLLRSPLPGEIVEN